jgi:hypothetical protein
MVLHCTGQMILACYLLAVNSYDYVVLCEMLSVQNNASAVQYSAGRGWE